MLEPLVLDNLRPGAEVITTDGHAAGKLYAILVDERDEEITHIVVNTGPFFPQPGFGAPTLKSVPIDQMVDAREKKAFSSAQSRNLTACQPTLNTGLPGRARRGPPRTCRRTRRSGGWRRRLADRW